MQAASSPMPLRANPRSRPSATRCLHDGKTYTTVRPTKTPALHWSANRYEEIVAKVQVLFEQGPGGIERGLDVLSDGQQSLFYFALVAAVFDLERDAVAGKIKGFHGDQLRIPALSVFAIEEPENHLSPYYISRIARQVRTIVEGDICSGSDHKPRTRGSRVASSRMKSAIFDVTAHRARRKSTRWSFQKVMKKQVSLCVARCWHSPSYTSRVFRHHPCQR